MRALLAGARRKQRSLLDSPANLSQAESPSDSKSAVDACVALAAARASISAAASNSIAAPPRQSSRSPLRPAPITHKDAVAKPILLLGHLDTVWPLGTLQSMPCRIRDGRLWGPGTLDMKAGVAMAFTAIELLMEAGPPAPRNHPPAQRRRGDRQSRFAPITENLARECSAVYVLEPAQGPGLQNRAQGHRRLAHRVKGVAAHAGVDFEKGANALRELARVIETVSGWTDLKRGLTVSVGVAAGGTKATSFPPKPGPKSTCAFRASPTARASSANSPPSKPADPRCKLTVTGGINRPPMERSRGTVRLFRKAHARRELGFELDEASTGGGSDGNFTAASAFPRSTAWARLAKARTRATSRSRRAPRARAPRFSPAMLIG
jgi:glutamate carboxypeptidase